MDATLQINLAKAKVLYPSAEGELRKMLEDTFGKDNLTIPNPIDKVHSLKDACELIGAEESDYLPFPNPKNSDQKCINAFAFMIAVAKAFNQGKKKDWKDSDQYKWFPWWRMNGSSGSGLSFDGADCGYSGARVASRLMVLDQEHVKIMAERFFKQYEDLMTEND